LWHFWLLTPRQENCLRRRKKTGTVGGQWDFPWVIFLQDFHGFNEHSVGFPWIYFHGTFSLYLSNVFFLQPLTSGDLSMVNGWDFFSAGEEEGLPTDGPQGGTAEGNTRKGNIYNKETHENI